VQVKGAFRESLSAKADVRNDGRPQSTALMQLPSGKGKGSNLARISPLCLHLLAPHSLSAAPSFPVCRALRTCSHNVSVSEA